MSIGTELRPNKSTNGRLFATPPPIRATFRILERAAPGIGARWAEHIWFTLPRRSGPPYAAPGASAGHAAGARLGGGVPFAIDVDGHEVVGESWGDGPAAYLLHGWAGHRGQLDPFVPALVAGGFRVVTFDAPSHGGSAPGGHGPRSSSVPEFTAALTAVVAAHGPAHAVVAHSLGAVAAAVALCDGLPAGRVVMLAPLAGPMSYAVQFSAILGFGDRIHRRLVARVERRIGAPMRHFDVPELGRAVRMPPTLIVHDRDDTSIPVSNGAAIASAWPGSRLHLTSGLGHRRILRDPAVVAEVATFLSA